MDNLKALLRKRESLAKKERKLFNTYYNYTLNHTCSVRQGKICIHLQSVRDELAALDEEIKALQSGIKEEL